MSLISSRDEFSVCMLWQNGGALTWTNVAAEDKQCMLDWPIHIHYVIPVKFKANIWAVCLGLLLKSPILCLSRENHMQRNLRCLYNKILHTRLRLKTVPSITPPHTPLAVISLTHWPTVLVSSTHQKYPHFVTSILWNKTDNVRIM